MSMRCGSRSDSDTDEVLNGTKPSTECLRRVFELSALRVRAGAAILCSECLSCNAPSSLCTLGTESPDDVLNGTKPSTECLRRVFDCALLVRVGAAILCSECLCCNEPSSLCTLGTESADDVLNGTKLSNESLRRVFDCALLVRVGAAMLCVECLRCTKPSSLCTLGIESADDVLNVTICSARSPPLKFVRLGALLSTDFLSHVFDCTLRVRATTVDVR